METTSAMIFDDKCHLHGLIQSFIDSNEKCNRFQSCKYSLTIELWSLEDYSLVCFAQAPNWSLLCLPEGYAWFVLPRISVGVYWVCPKVTLGLFCLGYMLGFTTSADCQLCANLDQINPLTFSHEFIFLIVNCYFISDINKSLRWPLM